MFGHYPLPQWEHIPEDNSWHDGQSSIYYGDSESYVKPRSEASQDSRFDQDSYNRQSKRSFEPRYPTVHSPARTWQ